MCIYEAYWNGKLGRLNNMSDCVQEKGTTSDLVLLRVVEQFSDIITSQNTSLFSHKTVS